MPKIDETILKVREFKSLPNGWHFGDGAAPPGKRLAQAVRLLGFADAIGLQRSNAFPGVQGQVEITLYNANRMLEVTIESDDSITVAEDEGRTQIYFEEHLSTDDTFRRIEEFGQSIWTSSSDHCTASITTRNVKAQVSQARLSTSETGNRFPLWIASAPEPRAALFVLILSVTTMSNLDRPSFTGQSATQLSLPGIVLKRRQLPAETSAIETFTQAGIKRLLDASLEPSISKI